MTPILACFSPIDVLTNTLTPSELKENFNVESNERLFVFGHQDATGELASNHVLDSIESLVQEASTPSKGGMKLANLNNIDLNQLLDALVESNVITVDNGMIIHQSIETPINVEYLSEAATLQQSHAYSRTR